MQSLRLRDLCLDYKEMTWPGFELDLVKGLVNNWLGVGIF